jgi:uncharacterized protein YkwD
MKRPGGIVITAVAIAFAFAFASPARSSNQLTTALMQSVNATRAQHHLGALRLAGALSRSAQLKADEIIRCGSFSHTPCGASFTRTFQQTGYFRGRARVGENLYWGTGGAGSPSNAVGAWLRSPPHRANLLGRWRDAGVGIVHVPSLFGHSDVWVFVLQFGTRG